MKDPVTHRVRQIEPAPLPLQGVHHPQRVAVVAKAPPRPLAQRLVQHLLADVPERGMPQVMPKPDRLGEVLVQPQRPRRRPRDAAGLEGVREARPVVVPLRRDENLRLVLEPAKRLGVDDPVAVTLEWRPQHAVGLGLTPQSRVGGRRELPQVLGFPGADPLLERERGRRLHRGCFHVARE